MACVMTFLPRPQAACATKPAGGARDEKRPEFPPGAGSVGGRADQKPDLISSNSEIIFSRNSDVVGDCMNSVPSTGSR